MYDRLAHRTQRGLDQQSDDLDVAVGGDDDGVGLIRWWYSPRLCTPANASATSRTTQADSSADSGAWLSTSSSDWPVAYSQTM